jgi:hypothetical protein
VGERLGRGAVMEEMRGCGEVVGLEWGAVVGGGPLFHLYSSCLLSSTRPPPVIAATRIPARIAASQFSDHPEIQTSTPDGPNHARRQGLRDK